MTDANTLRIKHLNKINRYIDQWHQANHCYRRIKRAGKYNPFKDITDQYPTEGRVEIYGVHGLYVVDPKALDEVRETLLKYFEHQQWLAASSGQQR